jgi:hypothetical protein
MFRLAENDDDNSIFSHRHHAAKAYLKELVLELEKAKQENADWQAEYEALRAENLATKASLLGSTTRVEGGRPPMAPSSGGSGGSQLAEKDLKQAPPGRRGSPSRPDTGAKLATLELLRQHMIDQGSFVEKERGRPSTDSNTAHTNDSPQQTSASPKDSNSTQPQSSNAGNGSANEGDGRMDSNSSLSQEPPSARDETRQGTEYSDGANASGLGEGRQNKDSSTVAPSPVNENDTNDQTLVEAVDLIQCAVLRQYAFQRVPSQAP